MRVTQGKQRVKVKRRHRGREMMITRDRKIGKRNKGDGGKERGRAQRKR